ncbi:MAG: DNA polymerase I [Gammaproteobacteria bacterium]|nr:DNA polymerase I [Gammaproteobacteria bacterium]
MVKRKLLILVDGSSYLYRAFHALPGLTTSQGRHTGAIYGVVSMVRKLCAEHDPAYMAVVFDAKGKTFRHEMYPGYKATRPPMPPELREQVEDLHRIIEAMGLPLISVPGVEADDVLATLARRASAQGLSTLVSTGDKDLAQIVDTDIELIDTMSNKRLNASAVIEKFGVAPEKIVDYLALIGDKSDNVPGVPKVGPKTAVKWIQEYESVDKLMDRAGEIKGKVGESLRETLEQLPLSRSLVTVDDTVDLALEPWELAPGAPDTGALRSIFKELEFSGWLSNLEDEGSSSAEAVEVDYQCLTNTEQLQEWLRKLENAELIAVDTETTALQAMRADLVGISFAVGAGKAAYIPLAHDYPGAPGQLDRGEVLEALRPMLEAEGKKKVGQNLKYDFTVLARCGLELHGIAYDTMLESYVLDSVANRHDMDTLSLKYLGHKTISYEDVAGKGKGQRTFNEVPLEQAVEYACEDADITFRLHQALWPRLEKQERLAELFERIEMPLIPVLAAMEQNGVRVDVKMLAKHGKQLARQIDELEQQAYEQAGTAFNIGSPKQIQEVLYERLGLPVLRKTPKGQPSTAENVLQELAVSYDLPGTILDHRALSKLKSTYTDKLPNLVNPQTGRIHTSYHQAVAATGRLSSSDPNLQNIPVRTAEGRRIREAFVPESGNVLLAADYSQIELRIMAHLSQDEGLLHAFREGEDVHRATASEIFGVGLEAVTADQRRRSKAVNFGLIYGMSAYGLSQQLRIPRKEAQQYIDLYFTRYPGVKAFMDRTRSEARDNGYVETVFGRRLYLPDIKSGNLPRRQYAERTAINAPMQGTAADIIKMAMLVVSDWIAGEAPEIKMIMQVHDELVFELPENSVVGAEKRIARTMSEVARLDVPLEVDVGSGGNWVEAHTEPPNNKGTSRR